MKVKKILTIMVVCFSGLIVWPAMAKATLVNSNSLIEDNIEYYMQTDKAVYDLGEEVQMLYRVTNLRDESVTFGFGWYPVYQFWVEKKGEQIWSAIGTRLAVATKLTLMPGESRVFPDFRPPFIWDMRDAENNLVGLGKYNAVGGLYNGSGHYDYTEVEVSIEIVPEPSSFLLFALGVFGIQAKHRNKYHR